MSSKYTEYWLQKRAAKQSENQTLAQKARKDVEKIVSVLVERFGARRIILFGSLAKRKFTDGSDIDLAVEGIPKDEYFLALAAANQITQFWVDLKPLEALEPHFLQKVLTTGECLYETNIC